jgi:2-keto-4-pentenoate hydratase/2-oxohepta-3-ene-1,7-dioic acid hydratase in catechol pathway
MAFRLATLNDRATLLGTRGVYDLAARSRPALADPMEALRHHDELHAVAATVDGTDPDEALDPARLGPCVPRPQKIFAIGLNYRSHAQESGMELPEVPLVFTKFRNCLTGPRGDVVVYGPTTDWEAELVVVIGRRGRDVTTERAWDHVAGLTCGQDVSERATQFAAKPPHFDLGKSFDTFGPIGPAVVSCDAVTNPDDLAIRCEVNGEVMQDARTGDLIFGVPALIAYLSGVCTLEPGDLIFTGTPAGVGAGRGRFLQPGDVVTTTIEGLGSLTNRCIAREPAE